MIEVKYCIGVDCIGQPIYISHFLSDKTIDKINVMVGWLRTILFATK